MKLKIVLFVFFAASVAGVPLSEVNIPPQEDEFDIPFLTQKVGVVIDDDGLNYRLPNNSIPLRYDLWLKTDVDKEIFEFEGRVKIHVKIVEATNTITLHYRQIDIQEINLLDVDETILSRNLVFTLDPQLEFVHITLPTIRQPNQIIVVDIAYTGILRTDGSGFYRASYTNDQVTTWFATTQFEMTDARHAMPCYDEPGIRAEYGIAIQHGSRYNAISNMPVATRVVLDGTDYVTTTFEDTVSMQTYLLAFVISDYSYVSNDDRVTEQRVYANPALITRGHGDFAVSVADPVLRQLENTLGVRYPLPKMDHAAITDYIWGAMENFGLITYREQGLLFNPDTGTTNNQKSIIELIAHEYAHQWFGDIVSPKWWSYNWLNEGFATLFSNYIPSLIYPESDHWDRFQSAVNTAFNVDTPTNNKPLNLYVQDPTSIRNKFDSIAYQKGGTYLRMMMEAMSPPTFLKGLNYYLLDMYLQSATPADLHRNLQKALDEDYPDNKVNLDVIMNTWEDQAGYPNIHVTKSADGFVLTQARYPSGSEIYSIPVSYALNEDEFNTKTVRLWMTEKTGKIESNNNWVILNVQLTGYYRVTYDQTIWAALIDTLMLKVNTISKFHKEQMFKDMRTSLVNEAFEAYNALRLLTYLKKEDVPSVWTQALAVEDILSNRLYGTDVQEKYQEYMKDIIQPHFEKLGLEAKTGDTESDVSMRAIVKELSCKWYNEDCFTFQLNKLQTFVNQGVGEYNLCDGLRRAGASLHTSFIEKLLATTVASERTSYINGLGCSLDAELINNFLNVAIDTTNSLTSAQRRSVIETTLKKSPLALATVLEFLQHNYAAIETANPGTFLTTMYALANYIQTHHGWLEVEKIMGLAKAAGLLSDENENQIIEVILGNETWLEDNSPNIVKILDGENVPEPTAAPEEPTVVPGTSTEMPSTTQGAGSLIASFSIIVTCAVFKMFA